MRFILDVHIPLSLRTHLIAKGHYAEHVNQLPNKWESHDSLIREHADRFGLVVVSKDRDFKHDHLVLGSPKCLVWIRLGNVSNKEILEVFDRLESAWSLFDNVSSFMIEVWPDGFFHVRRS